MNFLNHIKKLEHEPFTEQQAKLERFFALLTELIPDSNQPQFKEFTQGISITHVHLLCRTQPQQIVQYYPIAHSLLEADLSEVLAQWRVLSKTIETFLEEDSKRPVPHSLKIIAYLCYFIEQCIVVPNKTFFVKAAAAVCPPSTSGLPTDPTSPPQLTTAPVPSQSEQLLQRALALKAELAKLDVEENSPKPPPSPSQEPEKKQPPSPSSQL